MKPAASQLDADTDAEKAADAPAYAAAWSDRFVIGLLCLPVTYALGWFLLCILTAGVSRTPTAFEHFVTFVLVEITIAFFLIFLCASLWAITGFQRFSALAWKHFGKMILVILLSTAALFIVSAMLR